MVRMKTPVEQVHVEDLVYQLLEIQNISKDAPGFKHTKSLMDGVDPCYYKGLRKPEPAAAAIVILSIYNVFKEGVSYAQWIDEGGQSRICSDDWTYQDSLRKEISEIRRMMKSISGIKVPSETDILYAIAHRMGYELRSPIGIKELG